MEQSIISWLLEQAGPSAVAVLALIMLNAVWKKAYEDVRKLLTMTVEALNANTEATTRLIDKLGE